MKKCILVTGATGFLGSHLVKRLLKEGQDVVILKRSFSDTSRIMHEMGSLKSYNLDEISDVAQVFKDQHIDVVIHTATCYGRKEEGMRQIIETNFIFPLILLETATAFNTDTFFNTDTILSKYMNWYALSKKQFSEWGQQFARMGRIGFIDGVLEHMYGEDDSRLKFVTFLFESLKEGVPEINLTTGEQKRDFIYVGDVVEAYWKILTHQDAAERYQRYEIGTGKAVCIRDLSVRMKELLRSETKLNFGAIPYRENEVMESKADISGLQTLGWTPSTDIEEGILIMINYANKENILNTASRGGGGQPSIVDNNYHAYLHEMEVAA